MKDIRRIVTSVSLLAALAMPVLPAGTVAADTISSVQELHVSAKVLPMRHIIVDPTGQIIEITSNTSQDVTPQVFESSDKPENQRPLSDEIYQSYQRYTSAGNSKPGILYQRVQEVTAARKVTKDPAFKLASARYSL
jgi:hypothetical protein